MPPPRPNVAPAFDVFLPSDPILIDSSSPLHTPAWVAALSEYPGDLPRLIHGILTHGARIGYDGPEQIIISRNLPIDESDFAFLDAKTTADEKAGLISRATPSFPFVSSPLGVVPKHDGGRRRIHHLSYPTGSSVNNFIDQSRGTLSYTTFDEILFSIGQAGRGCILIKRDIRDAFRMIPVSALQRWLLGFSWRSVFYQEHALPFGLRTAPFIFNLFAEALHWILIFRGWPTLHHYLDDFITILSPNHAEWDTPNISRRWIQITDELGIPRKESKDEQGTTVNILGIEVDSLAMEARLPLEKLVRLRNKIVSLLQVGKCTLCTIESLAGLLSFCSRVVRLGRIFTQSSFEFIAHIHQAHRGGLFPLPRNLIDDLHWWLRLLEDFNGVRILDDSIRPTSIAFTDASSDGLGGYILVNGGPIDPRFAFSTRPKPALRRQHINTKEAAAALRVFQKWGADLRGHRLIFYTDSATVYSGITKGSTRAQARCQIRDLLLIAARMDIVIDCSWIPGKENSLADALSRMDAAYIAENYANLLQVLPTRNLPPPS